MRRRQPGDRTSRPSTTPPRRNRWFYPLAPEWLEARRLLATVAWTGGGDQTSWNDPHNWSTGALPTGSDDVVIDASAPGAGVTSSASVSILSLTAAKPLTISGGTFSIANASTLTGNVILTAGTLGDASGLTLEGPASTWSGGTLAGPVTNMGTLMIAGSGSKSFTGTLTNNGTIAVTGAGDIDANANNTTINNQAGATFDFQADANIYGGGSNFTGVAFNNAGTLKKSAGNGTSTLFLTLNDSALVEGDSGTLLLTSGTASNATVNAFGAGVVDISGGFSGNFSGSGTGTVLINGLGGSAPNGATLDFTGSVLQFSGGIIGGNITNNGNLAITGTASKTFFGTLTNNGTIAVTGAGDIDANANNTTINNQAGATFDFQADANIYGGGSNFTGVAFNNAGTLKKSAGNGTSTLFLTLNDSALVEGDSGTLLLTSGTASNATVNAFGAGVVDLSGGFSGNFSGSGTGTVLINGLGGSAPDFATLDFTGSVLQFSGGIIGGNITNNGNLAITGTTTKTFFGHLTNNGTIAVTGAGDIDANANNTTIINQAGATFDFQADASVYGGGSNFTGVAFNNAGTLKKSAGNGTSSLYLLLNDSGLIEGDSGTLLLNSGTANNATANAFGTGIVDLNGGFSGSFSGSGTGTVLINGLGGSAPNGATLDFTGSVLQFSGGIIGGNITNNGNLAISGTASKTFFGTLTNNGTIAVTGAGNISANANNTTINNQAGATFDFQADTSMFAGSNTGVLFLNAGTLEKSAGTGTADLDIVEYAPPGSTSAIYRAQSGTLDVGAGSVILYGQSILTGSSTAALQLVGNLAGTTQNADQFAPPGLVEFSGAGTIGVPQLLETMSQDLGGVAAGFNQNFAFNALALGTNTYVRLVDNADNSPGSGPEAVYANALTVPSGSTLDLNGLRLYAHAAQISGTVIGGNITLVSTAGPIALNTPTTGTIATSGEVNDMTVNGRAGQSLTVIVNTSSTGAPTLLAPPLTFAQVQLIDPSGNVLATASNTQAGANVILSGVPLPADGVYRIEVGAAPGHTASTGNYEVTSYDATVHTMPAALNQTLHGQLDTPYNLDQWTFSSVANQQVQFDLLAAADPSLQFSLTGPGGFVGFSGLSSNFPLLTLPATGTYTLSVAGAAGAYAFQIIPSSPINLPLNTYNQETVAGNGQTQLFAINVPVAAPLTVLLTDPSYGDHYELYASLGTAPTREHYDYQTNLSIPTPQIPENPKPAPSSPGILVSYAPAGTWYVLVYADSVAALPATYTISATAQPVEVGAVTPASYGANSTATLTVNGAGFSNTSTVALVAADGTTTYPATSVVFDTFTQLTATFNLSGVPKGTYGIRVTNGPGATDTQTGLFKVTAPGQAHFEAHVILPGSIGRHVASTLYVEYSNTGSVAMPAPLLLLESKVPDDLPLFTLDKSLVVSGFWTSAIPQGYSNTVEILASGRVPGVLEPGESFTVPVYYAGMEQPWNLSETQFKFDLQSFQTTNFHVVDWGPLQASMQPPGVSDAAWSTIYGNLTSQLVSLSPRSSLFLKAVAEAIIGGSPQFSQDEAAGLVGSWGGYVQFLDDEAAYLGQLGEDITDVSSLWGFAVQQADNALNPLGPVLASATDDSVATPGSLSLSFSRVFATSIDGRDAMGPLGLGWSTPWQTTADVGSDGTVTITGAGSAQRVFQPDSRTPGAYFSQSGDSGTLAADGHGGYLLTEADGTATDYSVNGQLNSLQDTNGNRITAGYTGGKLTSLTASSGQSITIAYNAAGLIATVSDSRGRVTTYSYDPTNHYLVAVQGFNGQTTAYSYDTASGTPGQNALMSIAFPGGTHQFFNYDGTGRLAGISNDGGEQARSYAYALGEVSTTDGLDNTSNVYYNEQGLAIKSVDPLGNTTLNAYDSNFNLYRVTDAVGQSETYAYNAAGEVTSSTDFLGHTTYFTYLGPFNTMSSMTDANGNVTKYAHDSAGNLTTTTYADGKSESFTYDPEGNAQSFLNANGEPINYTYNADGQVLTESFSDGSQYTYAYNAQGNLATATDATGTTTFTYDPTTELMMKVAYPSGMFLTFTYNAAGQRTQMVDQTGFTTNYSYDSVGRLSGLTDGSGNLIVTYTYDAGGRLSQKVNGNGTYTTYVYDADGNVLRLVNYAPDGTVNSRFDYTYNALGLETTEATLDGTWTYTYDADGQLIHAVFASTNPSVPSQDLAYNYDAMGNRTTTLINGVTTVYTTNNMNEYTSVGGTAYRYDSVGNLLSDGSSTYKYDIQNNLIAINEIGATTTYSYNALGQRVTLTANGQTTQFLTDPLGIGNIEAEFDSSGNLTAHFSYGVGLLAQAAGAGTSPNYYYDFDANSNTSDITNIEGSITNHYAYTPFGNTFVSTGAIGNPFLYVGQSGVTYDKNSVYYMRSRYYNVAAGRFTSTDPMGILGGPNPFLYGRNDPTRYSDPSGQISVVGEIVLGALAIGAAIYFAPAVLIVAAGVDAGLSVGAAIEGAAIAYPAETAFFLNDAANQFETTQAGLGFVIGQFDSGPSPPPTTPSDLAAELADKALKKTEDALDHYKRSGPGTAGNPARTPNPADDSGNGDEEDEDDDEIVGDVDPNSLLGPAGYGPSNFVAAGTTLPYQINFENAPIATAPAQSVTITDPLDPNLDWSTFQLTSIQWGDTVLTIPAGSQHYQTTVPMTYNGQTFDVDVEAGIHTDTGLVYATFRSIDPDTELPPDVLTGFLPPEDGTGRGMGSVSYVIAPKAGLVTGTAIRNVALVTFDVNAAIATDQVDDEDPSKGIDPNKQALVTIDGAPPASSVGPLPPTENSASFTVSWSAQDDPGGSGVGFYNIFVSDNGGPFTIWQSGTSATSATFTGEDGHSYAFYSDATDNAGNTEPDLGAAQATTTVHVTNLSSTSLAAVAGSGTFGGTATLTATLTAAGAPLAGESIAFTINGAAVGSTTTDANGVATLSGVSLAGIGAGSVSSAVAASFAGDTNDASASGSGDLAVNKATPSIAWANPAAIIYGTPLGPAQLDASSPVPGSFIYTPAANMVLNAGAGQTLSVQFTPTDTADYITTTATVTIDVDQAPLHVGVANASKMYGQPNPAFTASYSGFVSGQGPAALDGTLAFSTAATAASHVGPYSVTPSGLTSSNYTITFAPGTLTVTPAALTITANNQTRRFGGPLPALTAAYSGFTNGDTAATLATLPQLSTTAVASSPQGKYPIVATGAVDPDYTIAYQPGTLTVTPEVAGDYNGDGKTDIALFYRVPKSATAVWYVNTTEPKGLKFGSASLDVPVQGDFNGDGKADIAVYRLSTAQWFIAGQPTITFGQKNVSIPVPADYDGVGHTEVAYYQPNTGFWYIRGDAKPLKLSVAPKAGDIPVPADYDGVGHAEIAIYRPSTQQWYIQGHAQPIKFGGPNDVPVPGDYDGVGHAELALYRPATQQWFVGGHAQAVRFGGPGDVPVPGDDDGVGHTEYVLYRPSTGQWFIGGQPKPIQYGGPHMVPAAAPYAYRALSGTLAIRSAASAAPQTQAATRTTGLDFAASAQALLRLTHSAGRHRRLHFT